MSDEEVVFQKAPMVPVEWAVLCPSCGVYVSVPTVMDDGSGLFLPDPADRFLQCDDCDAHIEALPVTVEVLDDDEDRA